MSTSGVVQMSSFLYACECFLHLEQYHCSLSPSCSRSHILCRQGDQVVARLRDASRGDLRARRAPRRAIARRTRPSRSVDAAAVGGRSSVSSRRARSRAPPRVVGELAEEANAVAAREPHAVGDSRASENRERRRDAPAAARAPRRPPRDRRARRGVVGGRRDRARVAADVRDEYAARSRRVVAGVTATRCGSPKSSNFFDCEPSPCAAGRAARRARPRPLAAAASAGANCRRAVGRGGARRGRAPSSREVALVVAGRARARARAAARPRARELVREDDVRALDRVGERLAVGQRAVHAVRPHVAELHARGVERARASRRRPPRRASAHSPSSRAGAAAVGHVAELERPRAERQPRERDGHAPGVLHGERQRERRVRVEGDALVAALRARHVARSWP